MGTATEPHPREAIEARVGVEPIEDVQHRRRELVGANARLAALFGQFGRWEEKRKMYRNVIATEIAERLASRTVRKMVGTGKDRHEEETAAPPSEAELERLACADPRYRRLMQQAHAAHEQYLLNEHEITSLTEILNRDQALIRYAANEPR